LIVIWLPDAKADVRAIKENRSAWSEESGERVAEAIASRGEQIAEYPNSGRMIPEFQSPRLREVIEQGYRIFYQVFEDRIEVFGVMHSRQDIFRDA
jgi:toxin ParE1/3/4